MRLVDDYGDVGFDANKCFYCYRHHHYHHHHSLLHSTSPVSHNSTYLTDQALLIHCSANNFLTVRHVLSITAFCIRMHRAGWRLSIIVIINIIIIIIKSMLNLGEIFPQKKGIFDTNNNNETCRKWRQKIGNRPFHITGARRAVTQGDYCCRHHKQPTSLIGNLLSSGSCPRDNNTVLNYNSLARKAVTTGLLSWAPI